ncbi:MAG: hypothetical protein P4L82_11545 [Ancalomicrobiaceae bacterium]|nr:hypothetical protein [Ancalomicrobiaceae bacterium]
MPGLSFMLSEDHKWVTISFPTEPPIHLQIDAEEVVMMIERLGYFRAQMPDGRPSEWPNTTLRGAGVDPRWATGRDTVGGDTVLQLCDARFGWLAYLLPPKEAKALGEALVANGGQAEPNDGPPRPN